MKAKKPTSKRQSTKLREGIKKKVAAHDRKQRKLAKKDPTWKSKIPKDPGIPNSFPYKGKVLEEMEEAKRQEREEKERRREAQRQAARASGMSEEQIEEGLAQEDQAANQNRLAALVESANVAAKEYNGEEDDDDDMAVDGDEESDEINEIVLEALDEGVDRESSRKAYDKIYKQVVQNSDVILYVLDARNPEGTRSRQVEHAVLANPEKRLIFVVNKIDLVPEEILQNWRENLELSFPTIPLAAAHSAPNAQTFEHGNLNRVTTANNLLQSLKKYSQKKRSTSVGIIGYPNVGKSSVINALTRSRTAACPVGAQAGVTTSIRKVKIDSKLSVWDSPGIVFPGETQKKSKKKANAVEEHARLVLLNALPPKQIDDPRPAVSLLLKKLQQVDLLDRLYNVYSVPPIVTIPHDKFVTEFLVHVSRKMGRLGKGGVPDLDSAAQAIITDWRDGRIVGWEAPPTNNARENNEKSNNEENTQPVIVTEWASEFNLEGLWDPNTDIMQE